MNDFTKGLIEGTVSMAASIAALYIGTTLGLKARKKVYELNADERIDEEEEEFYDEDPELFND